MSLFNFFKKSKKIDNRPYDTTDNYTELFDNALDVFFNIKDDTDIMNELIIISKGSTEIAEQLYWFFPTILFHIRFPEVKRADDNAYTVFFVDEGVQKRLLYSNNVLYKAMEDYLLAKHHTFGREQTLSLLMHSAEFDAINKALNNGSKLEDLVVTSSYISFSDKIESEKPDKVELEKVSFKLQIEDVFRLKTSGVVVVGTISKGTIYKGADILITEKTGKVIKRETVSGLECPPKGIIEEAFEGEPVAILLLNTTKEEIEAGFFVIIQ